MLSRVAENLFWIGRYMERAENVARLADVARRMSALPKETGRPLSNEWASVLIAAGARDFFGEAIERADAGTAVDHLFYNDQNPSSVRACITAARENARSIRFALTRECWEALNGAWSHMRTQERTAATGSGLSDVIDWVKAQSALFWGAFYGTALRNDGFQFVRMGASIDRSDSTARLLDVKYHVLLPSVQDVGSGFDHYQWQSLLQAAAAQRAYLAVNRSDISARGVAAFLILNRHFPRSILFNAHRVAESAGALGDFYGQPAACDDVVNAFVTTIEQRTIDDIQAAGLHEFLTDVIERNYAVADALAASYGFGAIVNDNAQTQAQA